MGCISAGMGSFTAQASQMVVSVGHTSILGLRVIATCTPMTDVVLVCSGHATIYTWISTFYVYVSAHCRGSCACAMCSRAFLQHFAACQDPELIVRNKMQAAELMDS